MLLWRKLVELVNCTEGQQSFTANLKENPWESIGCVAVMIRGKTLFQDRFIFREIRKVIEVMEGTCLYSC